MSHRIALAAALTLLSVSSAAQTPTPAARKLAAESRCDAILTTAAAKAVAGLGYTTRTASGQTIRSTVVTTCTYDDASARSPIKPLTILTRRAGTAAEARSIFEQSKTTTYADGQPLRGLGEQALWSPSFGQVSVLRGQTWIIVTARKNEELATKIAKAIVGKIR